MKKKNLIILLLIPFVISFLSIVTVNMTFNTFNSDISSIEWDYSDIEAFKIQSTKYLLQARGVSTSQTALAPGNNLVWTVENKDSSITEPLAEITQENSSYYLKALKEGEVIITCSNEKGNVFKKMTGVLYDTGVIIVQPKILSSQTNIDQDIYYGEYDLNNKEKVPAKIEFGLTCFPNNLLESLEIVDISNNISVAQNNLDLTVSMTGDLSSLDASFTVRSNIYTTVRPSTYKFKIVEDGVNVYNYDQLLECTNRSKTGEIVVLRKSFVDQKTMLSTNQNNVTMFGGSKKDDYDFKKDVYYFETTYNKEFIRQWNSFAYTNKNYSDVKTTLAAALRIQKDFYGNGYTLNFHNLIYPTQTQTIEGITIPVLAPNDIYRGALPYYSLGDPNGLPIVTVYGQDNVGMLIDADNVKVNDVVVLNANTPSSLRFLETVGTVVEVNADNITIENSRISNGRNTLRSFSALNLTLKNSLLSTSLNFLISTGSNEYLKIDENTNHKFTTYSGQTKTANIGTYLNKNYVNTGDEVLNTYLKGTYTDSNLMRKSLEEIQTALDYGNDKISSIYKGSMVVDDVYFYNSGISAICMENQFNGPFLYTASPSEILNKFSFADSFVGKTLIPYTPTNISGISYPVSVEITGKTKFYDYKVASDIDLNGLLDENISTMLQEVTGEEVNFDIDRIFPLKSMLTDNASKNSCIYRYEDENYINVPVAYYGGGINLSTVTYTGELYGDLFKDLEIDLLENYLSYQSGTSQTNQLMSMMLKSVTVCIGFEPFKFICVNNDGYLFNESPNINDLIANAKGE